MKKVLLPICFVAAITCFWLAFDHPTDNLEMILFLWLGAVLVIFPLVILAEYFPLEKKK